MTSVCPFIEQNRQQDMDGTHRLAIGNPCRGSHRIKNNSHRRTKAAAKISLHFLVERRRARETMAAKRRVVREVPRLQICFTRQRCGHHESCRRPWCILAHFLAPRSGGGVPKICRGRLRKSPANKMKNGQHK